MMGLFIDIVIKSSVVLLLTLGITQLLRRQSAALRHLIWTVGLASALVIPLLGLVLPAWQPPWQKRLAGIAVNSLERIREVQGPQHPADFVQPIVQSAATPIAISAPVQPPAPPSRITPARVVLATWILGMLTVASLLLMEIIKLARVAIHSDTVRQQSWRDLASEVSRALRLKRSVRLMRNANASVLGTWGTFRPRVLLPRESTAWSGERMRVVLGHELAHVKRNDWLVQIVAESARAIYWFNPLFWIACAQLRRESEHACDDSALRLGVDGPTYAAHVLDLARTLKHSGEPGSAALAMANTSNLERRLIAMLNPTLNRTVTTKSAVAIVILLALALTLPLAAMQSPGARDVAPEIPLATPVGQTIPSPAVSAAIEHAVSIAEQASQKVDQASKKVEPVVEAIRVQSRVFGTTFIGQNSNNNSIATLFAAEPAQPAATQIVNGEISGTVSDSTGALVPGVPVVITELGSGKAISTFTNSSGFFDFPQLPPNVYSMSASLPGFQTSRTRTITVRFGENIQVKVPLRVGGISTVIDVSTSARTCLQGAAKTDGTPFTAADCPNGFVVPIAPRNSWPPAVEPPPDDIVVVGSSPIALPSTPLPSNGRRDPIRVGGDVQIGNLISHPSPAYPSEARQNGIEGSVIIEATIAIDGTLQFPKVLYSSDPLLEGGILGTLQQWRYKPTLLNAQPVAWNTKITVNYTLGR